MDMIKVVCCKCGVVIYLKPGKADGDSHSFCQACLDVYCKENGLDPVEITIPKGAIINHECFPQEISC